MSGRSGGKGHAHNSIKYQTFRRVGKRDGFHCRACGTKDFAELTLDHIWPLSRDGCKCWLNIQLLCDDCNAMKGATIEEGSDRAGPMGAFGHTREQCPARTGQRP